MIRSALGEEEFEVGDDEGVNNMCWLLLLL